jgi:hypothetical protein
VERRIERISPYPDPLQQSGEMGLAKVKLGIGEF